MAMRKKNLGQSLVEFALVVPLLLILVIGLFDIGRAVVFYAVLNTAVREGTRLAIVQDYEAIGNEYEVLCTEAQSIGNISICSEVEEKLFNIATLSNSTVLIQHFNDGKDDPVEHFVRVSISYEFEPVTPGLNLISNFTLNARSQMLKSPVARP